MAIHIFCVSCKTSNKVDAKQCSRCGLTFGRDKKYRVCVSVKGHRQTRVVDNLTLARETEATIKCDLVRNEFEISHHRVNRIPTLNDLWARYLPWSREQKKSWRTDAYYFKKHLEPRFGSKTLDNIKPFDIEKMKSELRKGLNAHGKPYAAQTIKHQIVILRRLYNLARKWGIYRAENPVHSVQIPQVNNEKTEFLTDEQLTRLLETLENWPCRDTVAIVKFALLTGLRRGELFKLTWDDVNFERNLITLRDPKPGKDQTVTVSDAALDVLRALEVNSSYVFPGKDGKQRIEFKGPWLRIRKAAGLPKDFRFHDLRHNFGSQLVSSGVDLVVVRELLHHVTGNLKVYRERRIESAGLLPWLFFMSPRTIL